MFMQKHSRFRIHSQYEMLNWVREINPEPQLDIHPKDAKARDIDDGEYVRVYNDRGEMVVKAKYNDAFQPGLVNTDQGVVEPRLRRGSPPGPHAQRGQRGRPDDGVLRRAGGGRTRSRRYRHGQVRI